MTVLSKQPGPGGNAVLHFVANGSCAVADLKVSPAAGNTNFANDNVTAFKVIGATWSGSWEIKRGANLIIAVSGSGQWDLGNHGISIGIDKEAQLNANLTTGTGTMILHVRKEGELIR